MLLEIKKWLILNKLKTGLLISNLAIFGLAVIFYHSGILPISQTGDLIFWLVLIFALALYRPGWAFLFFVGTLILENISLTAPEIGLTLRIYQALGALIIAAILIRWIFKKKSGLKTFRLENPDYLMLVFLGGSFLSALFSEEKLASLKITLVVLSFTMLYFLTRSYIQDYIDLKKIIPFFLTTSLGVVIYGILQSIFFIQDFSFHGEVMLGRPNATFTEPNWLGIYLLLLISIIYSLIFYFNRKRDDSNSDAQNSNSKFLISNQIPNSHAYWQAGNFQKYFVFFALYFFLTLVYILLILTVSRSAWLGAGLITLVFLKAILTDFSWHWRVWRWKIFLQQAVFVVLAGTAGVLIVFGFNLTSFQLFDRAQSTGTGLQKITIACRENIPLPEKIDSSEELIHYGCRHINLEEIKKEARQGNQIKEIYRPDPNVNIRSQVFQRSWEVIRKHPILGIGYGVIPVILGQDERGTSLNTSNIFLEVWLGSGIIGLIAFFLIWLNAVIIFIKRFRSGNSQEEQSFALFVLLGIFAFLIPNLFNAGIFLMILWFFWGIVPIKFKS